MESDIDDLRLVEPAQSADLIPTTLGWEAWCIIVTLGILALLLILLLWWKLSKRGRPESINQAALAYNGALAKLAICPSQQLTATATECSIILRRYLADLTDDPAIYETHEEWVSRHHSIEAFCQQHRDRIHSFFSELAVWKYSPSDHGDDPATIIERSRDLLKTIHMEAGQ